jgi:hypothetical protein
MAATEIVAQLEQIASRLGAGGTPVTLERPRNADHGDFATNLALVLAKRLGRPPRDLAGDIVAAFDTGAAGPQPRCNLLELGDDFGCCHHSLLGDEEPPPADADEPPSDFVELASDVFELPLSASAAFLYESLR